jgi:hypothetical protein
VTHAGFEHVAHVLNPVEEPRPHLWRQEGCGPWGAIHCHGGWPRYPCAAGFKDRASGLCLLLSDCGPPFCLSMQGMARAVQANRSREILEMRTTGVILAPVHLPGASDAPTYWVTF